MYCPKCSQQQVSDDLRFCSRCGFQLGVVKELLAQSNNAPAVADESETRTKFFSRRKQDLLFGATFIYIAAVVTVQFSWFQPKAAIDIPLGMVWLAFSLFVLFFDALMRVARKLFSEDAEPAKTKLPSLHSASSFITKVNSSSSALPPAQSVPLTALGSKRVNTGEMVRPPSITEHTTDLLNRSEKH